jgi:hypothetical protein
MYKGNELSNGHEGTPILTSFDTGYEHSLEHLVYVRRLVEEADAESGIADAGSEFRLPVFANAS